jgi:hypothetical protein
MAVRPDPEHLQVDAATFFDATLVPLTERVDVLGHFVRDVYVQPLDINVFPVHPDQLSFD